MEKKKIIMKTTKEALVSLGVRVGDHKTTLFCEISKAHYVLFVEYVIVFVFLLLRF